jgi:uncharacterized protein (TIGR02246 family)
LCERSEGSRVLSLASTRREAAGWGRRAGLPDSSGAPLAASGVSAYSRSMQSDEQAIRNLIATWHRATAEGDLSRLLTLMSNDVVFLTAVQPPMSKEAFAAGFQAMLTHARIESNSEIKEIRAFGDWAYCWSHLSVIVTPRKEGKPVPAAGTPFPFSTRSPMAHGNLPATRTCSPSKPRPLLDAVRCS